MIVISCLFPLKGFDTGIPTDNGKRSFIIESNNSADFISIQTLEAKKKVFDRSKLIWKDGTLGLGDPVYIPCGSCYGCRLDRAKDWTTRLITESREHAYTYFVTLTYDDEHVPKHLVKSDLQKFMKRFRLEYPCRFFACGEYGEETQRPHYHLILFMEVPLLSSESVGVNRFHNLQISKCWKNGLHEVSVANEKCMAYVAGYVVKKCKMDLSKYEVPPFVLMSRRPGIGYWYFLKHEFKSLKVYTGQKNTARLPRYFKDKLEWYPDVVPELLEQAKRTRDLDINYFGTTDLEIIGKRKNAILLEKHNRSKKL